MQTSILTSYVIYYIIWYIYIILSVDLVVVCVVCIWVLPNSRTPVSIKLNRPELKSQNKQ